MRADSLRDATRRDPLLPAIDLLVAQRDANPGLRDEIA